MSYDFWLITKKIIIPHTLELKTLEVIKMLKEKLKRGNVTVDIVIDDTVACCRPVEICINGVKANFYDIGRTVDVNPELAPPCGCGNRTFIMKPIKAYTLQKYKLKSGDEKDLEFILKKRFSVGFCRRCD